jgi:hypothetical protein
MVKAMSQSIGRRRRARIAPLYLCITLSGLACGTQGTAIATRVSEDLRAVILSCPVYNGSQELRVGFEATATTPKVISPLMPSFSLYSYSFRPATSPAADAVEVNRSIPLGPGWIDLQSPSPGSPRTAAGPPPIAVIPLTGAVPDDLAFTDMRLAIHRPVEIRAPNLAMLRGEVLKTPMGDITVSDVSVNAGTVAITLANDWGAWAGPDFALNGPSDFDLVLEGVSTIPTSIHPTGSAGAQLQFPLSSGEQGPVAFRLDQFVFTYSGSVEVQVRDTCA